VPNLGSTELIILLVVILLVFGAKRLPDSARSLGRSMRIFKAETKGLREDGSTDVTGRDTSHDTTVHAEPLPPVHPVHPSPPPAPAAGYGAPPAGDQAQQPRP
jgi:sec-independent protein translocase protein TatA